MKRKLKICIVGDISTIHVRRVANFFADMGHDLHVVDDHYYAHKNLKLHYLKNYTGIKFIDYISRLIRGRNIIRRLKPDLVYGMQVTYHAFLGALSNVHPFIAQPWGSDILSVYEKSIIFRKIVKYVFDKADVIHYLDTSGIDRVSEIYGDTTDKAFVLKEGANINIFKRVKMNKAKKKISILCLRVRTEGYNSLLLIESANILINKLGYRDIEFLMAKRGDSDYIKRIDRLVKEYNLSEYIRYFDWIIEEDHVRKIMNDADIYVDTIDRPKKGQGTGNAALEAMACELALAMPSNPSIELYIKHRYNGLIYQRNDPVSLAMALEVLIRNKKLRLKLGKNARKFVVEKFDWNRNIKLLERKFYEVANKSNFQI